MIKEHLYTGRAPFTMPLTDNPIELTPEYIMEACLDLCERNNVAYINHTLEIKEERDGTIVEGGIEMPASRREYFLLIETQPYKGDDDPKGY